jgi:hypothetical protein
MALIVPLVGCGPKNPDYHSIWTTSTTTTSSETPVPFAQYLESSGVTGEQVAPDKLTDLTVSIPTPPGWEKVDKPNIPPTTEMIGKGGNFPTAMLMVFKLNGDFDAADVVRHGNADATLSENFKLLDQSGADFHGFPSSMIEGSYDLKGAPTTASSLPPARRPPVSATWFSFPSPAWPSRPLPMRPTSRRSSTGSTWRQSSCRCLAPSHYCVGHDVLDRCRPALIRRTHRYRHRRQQWPRRSDGT